MKWFVFALVMASAVACNSKKDVSLENAVDPIEKVPERMLMHDVYLNLVDSINEADRKMCLAELKRLEKVETTHWLHVGLRAETGDARLNKEYDLALHVVFLSKEDMDVYAVDPLHINVKENIKEFLASPPVVYDYWVE